MNPPAMQETQFPSLGWEDPLDKGMAIHSSVTVWENSVDRGEFRGQRRIPWTEDRVSPIIFIVSNEKRARKL